MPELRTELEGRREEFEAHFALTAALENRMMLDASLGDVNLSVRHINTLKSGLIIHLYNIEEALMTEVLQFLGREIGNSDPKRWSEYSLKEWLRESIVRRMSDANEEGRLVAAYNASSMLLSAPSMGPINLKKPSGTWDDKVIATFSRRMNVVFNMPPEMWARIAAQTEYGEKTPLQFLAKRRNDIAHGRRSFEEGASDLGLNQIRKLADVTLDYLGHVADAFQGHIDNDRHLVAVA